MARFNLRVVHKQFYDVLVEAESPEQAKQLFMDQGEFYPDGPEFDEWQITDIENLDD